MEKETVNNEIHPGKDILESIKIHLRPFLSCTTCTDNAKRCGLVITFCVGKLFHFSLITLLHFELMLLHFALELHFAAIVMAFCVDVITFCVSITYCGDYYILRRNKAIRKHHCC